MLEVSYDTRGNRYKLVQKLCMNLPDEVVSVSSVGSFKKHLDGFWCNQDLYYDYKADI